MDWRVALARVYISYGRVNFFINVVIGLGVALIIGSRLMPGLITIGFLLFLLVQLLRLRELWHASQGELTVAHAERLLHRALYWSPLSGAFWGSTALLAHWLDPERQMALLLVIVGMTTGSAITLSPTPRALRRYLAAILLPYSTVLIAQATLLHTALAVLSVALLWGMSGASKIMYRTMLVSYRASDSARSATQTLLAAQTEWAELCETAEAFALFDAERRLLLWNDAYTRLLGLPNSAMARGAHWLTLSADANADDLPEARALVGANSGEFTALMISEHERGGLSYRSTVRHLSNNHIAISHVDVTALKRRENELLELQAALQDARDRAEAASDAKSRFLANISHELRTPLNAVIGFSDLMAQDHAQGRDDTARHSQYARTILQSGQHLLSLVEDILDLARIESGKVRLVEQTFDLVDLVASVAQIALGNLVGGERNMQLRLPPGPLMIDGDPRLLRQALINVIGNAAKFSAAGGLIQVGLRDDDMGDLLIEVADNGIGIAADMLDAVVQPFTQVEATDVRRFGGVGLGLPLAKQFTELHGGRLTLDSTLGGGTTVTIRLPAIRRRDWPRAIAARG